MPDLDQHAEFRKIRPRQLIEWTDYWVRDGQRVHVEELTPGTAVTVDCRALYERSTWSGFGALSIDEILRCLKFWRCA